MRKRLIAGNWKMNMHWDEAMTLVEDLVDATKNAEPGEVDIAIFPPYLFTRHAVEFCRNAKSIITIGGQDCASTENGAYTGEISASMLASVGAEAVIVGHSERREYFNEPDRALLSKVNLALQHGLTPFFCCGEHLKDRTPGNHFDVVTKQLNLTILTLNREELAKVVIAYEPVWAIGTGETATPQQAQEMHAHIRSLIARSYDQDLANDMRILYGGSMKPDNASELLAQEDVDGGLIGGASLLAEDFVSIVQA